MTERLQRFTAQRLFLRIFLWFWTATILLLATYALTSGSFRPAWGVAGREMLPHMGVEAADALEAGGPEQLTTYLAALERRSQLNAYLLDATRAASSGQTLPREAHTLASKLSANHRVGSMRTLGGAWLGTAIVSSSGKSYFFIAHVPWRLFWIAPPAEDPMWLPLVTILFVGGLIWYWLARKLAAPATLLRSAARTFAAGDLSARVTDPKVLRQGDELAELAREFNAMADRIEKLIVSQKRLIGDISHELGSPLARLRLAVGLARKQLGPGAQAHLDRVDKEAERLDELTQQVLELVRADSVSNMKATDLRLDELVRGVASDADLEATAKGCRVLIGSIVACRAHVYPDLLRSALENVIRNAVKYTANNTAVQVDMRGSGIDSCVHILVQDQGPGVPEESLPHLFEPFYRVEPARDRESGGTGLGLSIARQAIEKHGGTIHARNLPEGGLTVDIQLYATVDSI